MNRKNVLIEIAEDCGIKRGTIPETEKSSDTITMIQYDELSKNPYKYNEYEFQKQVHHIRREKPELNIDKYDIRRSELCKKYGWGIHINEEGKVALVGAETDQYKALQVNPSIKKVSAYKKVK